MEDILDILTELKIRAHYHNEKNKEAKIDLVIKVLKVVMQNE